MKKHKSLKKSTVILISVFLICIILNGLSWISTGFCDRYAKYIFPLWTNTLGRLTSLMPFSFGEILIIIAVVGLPLSLIAFIILMIFNKGGRKKIRKAYRLTYLWIIAFIALTETLNCFILYHCSSFAKLHDIPEKKHSSAQLEQLAVDLIKETNKLAVKVNRDDEGHFILTADLDETAKQAMRNLGEEFPSLAGYYVTPKPVKHSYFMSQQYLMGIYFPFTMEANYNRLMYPHNLPDTVCHELAHTKGFIQEDEANFIAFLACVRSDNIDYQYSGYVNALKYVLGKIDDFSSEEKQAEITGMIADEVLIDYAGNSDYWKSVQEDESGLISSKTIAEVSDKAMEASLRINGVEDGKKSYGRMVDLLLNYYYDLS